MLAGLLVGLLAQGLALFDAATLAVWLHARAAELALEVVGPPRRRLTLGYHPATGQGNDHHFLFSFEINSRLLSPPNFLAAFFTGIYIYIKILVLSSQADRTVEQYLPP